MCVRHYFVLRGKPCKVSLFCIGSLFSDVCDATAKGLQLLHVAVCIFVAFETIGSVTLRLRNDCRCESSGSIFEYLWDRTYL